MNVRELPVTSIIFDLQPKLPPLDECISLAIQYGVGGGIIEGVRRALKFSSDNQRALAECEIRAREELALAIIRLKDKVI